MNIYHLIQFLWVRNTGTTQLGVLAWESLRKLWLAQPPKSLTGAETLLAWLASSSWLLVEGLNHVPQRAQGCLSVLTAWQPASPEHVIWQREDQVTVSFTTSHRGSYAVIANSLLVTRSALLIVGRPRGLSSSPFGLLSSQNARKQGSLRAILGTSYQSWPEHR